MADNAMKITASLSIDERDIDERFVRASGPGGQNVNKLATAVELRFHVAQSSLPAAVKRRLVALAGRRMTADGALLIRSRVYRTQGQNRDAARLRLAGLIRRALVAPAKRTRTTVSRGERQQRLTAKKQRAAVKASRGPAREED